LWLLTGSLILEVVRQNVNGERRKETVMEEFQAALDD
jgi:hypothetical protein